MRPVTVRGRAWTVGLLAVGWVTGGIAHALAADASFVEQEPRSQQVVVVKPEGADQPSEAKHPPDKIVELKRTIREEQRQRDLLELKLNSLRERVEAEWTRVPRDGRGLSREEPVPAEMGAEPVSRRHSAVVGATESGGLVREYIWIPPHREGDKLIEGHYQLREE